MCIIAVALDSHPDFPFIAIANRDEYRDRPAAAAHRWPPHPSDADEGDDSDGDGDGDRGDKSTKDEGEGDASGECNARRGNIREDECIILAGRDLTKSGTWLGVEVHTGRFAAVTNYRLPSVRPDRGGAAAAAAEAEAEAEAEDGEKEGGEDDSSTRKRLKKSGGGGRRSRGELPVRFLRCGMSPLRYLKREVGPRGGEYDGFNLVVYDPKFGSTTKTEETETAEGGGGGGGSMAEAMAAHYCNVVRNRVVANGGAEDVDESKVSGNAHGDDDEEEEAARAKPRPKELKCPGIHIVSNGPIGTKWPKMRRLEEALSKILRASSSSSSSERGGPRGPTSTTPPPPPPPPAPAPARPLHERLFDVLSDATRASDEELPSTGLDLRWERDLSSIFVRCDPLGYGTLCSTVVLVDGSGAVNFWERTFEFDDAGEEDEDRDEDGSSRVKVDGAGESCDADVEPKEATGGKISSEGNEMGRTRTVHYSFVVGNRGGGDDVAVKVNRSEVVSSPVAMRKV